MDAPGPKILLAVALLAACPLQSRAQQPPQPLPDQPAATPQGQPVPLAQPISLRPAGTQLGVRQAFELERRAPVLPPVRLATATAAEEGACKPLFAEASRLTGRGRSISDLTDLVERCDQAIAQADAARNDQLYGLASWAYNRRGELRVDAQQPREAFDDFQHAVVLDKNNAAALNNRGILLAQHGQQSAALADFAAAILLQPEDPVYRRNRAELNAAQGDYASAIQDYNAALAAAPRDAASLTGRGYCWASLGKLDQAVRDYNRALADAPHDAQTLTLRGSLYATAGYYEQAIADLNTALAANPTDAAAYQSAAWMLATCPDSRFRDPTQSVEAARRALHFGSPDDPLLLDVAAAAYAASGQHGQAVRLAQQAALAAPATLRPQIEARLALYQRGQAYRADPPPGAASIEGAPGSVAAGTPSNSK